MASPSTLAVCKNHEYGRKAILNHLVVHSSNYSIYLTIDHTQFKELNSYHAKKLNTPSTDTQIKYQKTNACRRFLC